MFIALYTENLFVLNHLFEDYIEIDTRTQNGSTALHILGSSIGRNTYRTMATVDYLHKSGLKDEKNSANKTALQEGIII